MVKLKLTQEGLEYLKNGLPEARLVKLLENKPLQMQEASKKIPEFGIALQWSKKNGWVKIEGDKLILIKKLKEIEKDKKIEGALTSIKNGEYSIDGELLIILQQRRLVERERQDELTVAQKFVGKEVDKLTPELIKTGLWKKNKART